MCHVRKLVVGVVCFAVRMLEVQVGVAVVGGAELNSIQHLGAQVVFYFC